MQCGTVEDLGGFEGFEFAVGGGLAGALDQRRELGVGQRLEGSHGLDRLLENVGTINAGDDGGDGEVHGVVEAFDGLDGLTLEDDAAGHGLHSQHTDLLVDQHGEHLVSETAEMEIHDVQGHLHGIEAEVVLAGCFQHAQMNQRILVAGETDEPDLAGFLGVEHGADGAVVSENPIGVFQANHFVKLHQVNMVGLQPLERLIDLASGGLAGSAVDLGHQENPLSITVLEGIAEADLALAVVIVPAIVHERYALVDRAASNAGRLGGIRNRTEVEPTQADERDVFTRSAERTVDHVALADHVRAPGTRCVGSRSQRGKQVAGCGGGAGSHGHFQEIAALHGESSLTKWKMDRCDVGRNDRKYSAW